VLDCGNILGSYRAARRRRARPRGGGSLQMVSEPTLAVSWESVVAVVQAWCAWLVWVLTGHTAWHMCYDWTHGCGQERTFLE
jgi:hypothetical protein